MAKYPLDLIPNEIHDIKPQPGAMILMSAKEEVNHVAMNLINVTNLLVEHLLVDPMQIVIHGEEVLGAPGIPKPGM
jgi:hypothetical protein